MPIMHRVTLRLKIGKWLFFGDTVVLFTGHRLRHKNSRERDATDVTHRIALSMCKVNVALRDLCAEPHKKTRQKIVRAWPHGFPRGR